eukprot:2887759-Rhodomonas_salina.1
MPASDKAVCLNAPDEVNALSGNLRGNSTPLVECTRSVDCQRKACPESFENTGPDHQMYEALPSHNHLMNCVSLARGDITMGDTPLVARPAATQARGVRGLLSAVQSFVY